MPLTYTPGASGLPLTLLSGVLACSSETNSKHQMHRLISALLCHKSKPQNITNVCPLSSDWPHYCLISSLKIKYNFYWLSHKTFIYKVFWACLRQPKKKTTGWTKSKSTRRTVRKADFCNYLAIALCCYPIALLLHCIGLILRQACSSHHQIVIWICFWFSAELSWNFEKFQHPLSGGHRSRLSICQAKENEKKYWDGNAVNL